MAGPKRFIHFAICCAVASSLGCAKTDTSATDTAGVGADVTPPAGLSAADMAGKWNIRAVAFSGDTTPILSVLAATGDNTGWTTTFPKRPAIATRVSFDGDSVMTESGPYESVIRKGVQVTTNGVYRLRDGSLAGITVARYATRGVDSVTRFRVTGTRAP
jgi:hypothetical protein